MHMARIPLLPSLPSLLYPPSSISLSLSLSFSSHAVNDIKQTFKNDTVIHMQTDNCDTYIFCLRALSSVESTRERKRANERVCGVCASTGAHAYVCVHVTVVVFVRASVLNAHEHLLSTRHTDGQGCLIYRFLPEVCKLYHDLHNKN